ncbi:oxidative stress defense protein [Vibrio hannami]|uniref:oxidative stress defense protein n=1 Tax=Vibrio hannami TaxID=2717094 RepID=UPI00240F023C|nr:oxidative stress defense protein [Vibrio hannami]MDG3087134.1 oxidative stress defense protein [Vibrio hannami]
MKKLLVAVSFVTSFSLHAATPDFAHIETNGYGEVVAKPDLAEFKVQVVESALNAEQAKKAVDRAVIAFHKRLAEAGIDRRSISSTNIHLAPQYHYPKSGSAELVGYRASRQITVTLDDLPKLNDLLDKALGDGISRIDDILLKVSDREKYQEQARILAIKDANRKAHSLAEGFHGTLDGVWKVSYQARSRQPMMRAMAMDAGGASDTGYQDTSITISDSVNVIYRFQQN